MAAIFGQFPANFRFSEALEFSNHQLWDFKKFL